MLGGVGWGQGPVCWDRPEDRQTDTTEIITIATPLAVGKKFVLGTISLLKTFLDPVCQIYQVYLKSQYLSHNWGLEQSTCYPENFRTPQHQRYSD